MTCGFNALQCIYYDVREPIYSVEEEQFDINPFAQFFTGNEGIRKTSFYSLLFYIENTTISRTENTDPLPNPWACCDIGEAAVPSRQTQQQYPVGSTNTQIQQQQAASTISTDGSNSSLGLISPMMQNFMLQLVQNLRLFESILNVLYMQPFMDSLAINPDISRQMIINNPELREQMLNVSSAMMERTRNPEIQALVENQETFEAIRQIQEG
jgi:hypothetical protein